MSPAGEGVRRVGIAFPFTDETVAAFRAASPRLELRLTAELDQAAVDGLADDDLDGLVALSLPSRPGPRLRWLQVPSTGVDHLRGDAWPDGVTLTNARGAHAGAMAQFAIAAVLRSAEPLADRAAQQRAGRWPDDPEALSSRRLRGRTAVLLGYGGIGREIARLADALGLRVVAVKSDPDRRADDVFHLPGTGDPEGRIPERFVGVDRLAEAVTEADYLVITLPLTERSRGLVSATVLAALPERAWIVNIGRGPVIDERALVAALEGRRIAGATLDVFEEEPLPADSPLWAMPNVEITPHVAGAGADLELELLISENLRRFGADEPLLNVVDVGRGY